MRYVLGFDGGGTKTECFVMDEHGNVLGRAQSGPSNPGRVGLERAVDAIRQSAAAAIAQAHVERPAIAAICAGLSGAGYPKVVEAMSTSLAAEFPAVKIKVCTDLDIALAAAGEGPAIVLIAGTGSVAVGRGTAGGMRRAGGLGPQLGDEGSATDIGRKALAVARMHREKTGEESPLGKQMMTQLGHAAKNPTAEMFPRLFPVVANAADTDDELARGILRDAAGHLAALVKTLVNELGLEKVPFRLAKTGGMIGRCAFFDDLLDRHLQHAAPHGKIGLLPILPAHAAALIGLEILAGGGNGDRFV
ncbi:MAG: BadF/BadG/BcrA/BcrD ATPase family protein [Candidatus Acidiferrum sp.]